MSAISLRLPNTLHRSVREMAEKEHVSINQIITLALAEKVSALMTDEYLSIRAKRGSKAKFLKAMGKVSKTEPDSKDKLH
jgi:predicted transcriptional regulator